METLAELPFIGDQVVCLSHDQGARSGPAEHGAAPRVDTRRALALGTGQRNIAAALVVASESFSDPSVVIMVIVVTIVGLLTLMPLCHVVANRGSRQSTKWL